MEEDPSLELPRHDDDGEELLERSVPLGRPPFNSAREHLQHGSTDPIALTSFGCEDDDVPGIPPLERSYSTPVHKSLYMMEEEVDVPHQGRMVRASSADPRMKGGEFLNRETYNLVQELAYHTDSTDRQLKELCWRLGLEMQPHDHDGPVVATVDPEVEQGSSSETAELVAVLKSFGLSTEPDALRSQLQNRLRPPRTSISSGDEKVPSTISREWSKATNTSVASETPRVTHRLSSASTASDDPKIPPSISREWSKTSVASNTPRTSKNDAKQPRIAVRLQIYRFLSQPKSRVEVLALWQSEVESAESVSWLQKRTSGASYKGATDWYERHYKAFELMFSNYLDENDSPIRGVLFDMLSQEAKKLSSETSNVRPQEIDGTKKAVRGFVEAVLDVAFQGGYDKSERNQWEDCLHRLDSQYARALEDTFNRVWPTSAMTYGFGMDEHGVKLSAIQSIQQTLSQNSVNALHLEMAMKSVASHVADFEKVASKNPQQFWNAYLQQAISASKTFLQLAREMTLLTGVWTLASCNEVEHVNSTVMRREYRRVRRGFAAMLLKRSREIVEKWNLMVASRFPNLYAKAKNAFQDMSLNRTILGSIIEWWKTSHSSQLRAACMDIVAMHSKGADWSAEPPSDQDLQALIDTFPLFEEIVLEVFRKEVVVQADSTLSIVDEPRVLDILARLTHELSEHLASEWHITLWLAGKGRSLEVLPRAELFQVPDWKRTSPFYFNAVKTEFLKSEIQRRFVVERYVRRGAYGRVWEVTDDKHVYPFQLCLKTFFCEYERDEFDLGKGEYLRNVVSELSQVDRWMTSCSRLRESPHIVKVVKVFKDAEVKRPRDGCEGTISGILMEFCDQGELASYLWDKGAAELSFTLANIDYDGLKADEARFTSFKTKLRDCIASGAGAGVERNHVKLEMLSSETVKIIALIQSADMKVSSVLSSLKSNLCAPSTKLVECVERVSGIGNFTNGAITVSDISVKGREAQRREFDERTAQFLFAQLVELLKALFAPPGMPSLSSFSHGTQDDQGFAVRTYSCDSSASLNEMYDGNDRTASGGSTGDLSEMKTKYFHNDIKLENLVVSGTTLKLIDFQSIRPIKSNDPPSLFEHGTLEYRQRYRDEIDHGGAEARAEASAIWACGVILTRLLAAQLPHDWVYNNFGLGDLDEILPSDHCLLSRSELYGPRRLLEYIFCQNDAPCLDVLMKFPWVRQGKMLLENKSVCNDVQLTLAEIQRSFTDNNKAWIQLSSYFPRLDGQADPVDKVHEILSTAVSLSNGEYRLLSIAKPQRFAQSQHNGVEDDVEDATYSEWRIGLARTGMQLRTRRSSDYNDGGRAEEDGVDSFSPITFLDRKDSSASTSSRKSSGWNVVHEAMFSDRFEVTLRPRDDVDEIDHEDSMLWWLSVKWRTPMVSKAEYSHFVRLQQLIVEGLAICDAKRNKEADEERLKRAPTKKGTLTLPLFR